VVLAHGHVHDRRHGRNGRACRDQEWEPPHPRLVGIRLRVV
jgi:hypothetical protein